MGKHQSNKQPSVFSIQCWFIQADKWPRTHFHFLDLRFQCLELCLHFLKCEFLILKFWHCLDFNFELYRIVHWLGNFKNFFFSFKSMWHLPSYLFLGFYFLMCKMNDSFCTWGNRIHFALYCVVLCLNGSVSLWLL